MSFPFVCRVALDHNMIFENTFLACGTPFTPRNARNRSKHLTGSLSLRIPCSSSRTTYLIRKLIVILRFPAVFTVCKLSTDLNVVPRHMFEDQKKFRADGEPYYLIEFNLTVKIQTTLVFSFVFKGKEYSTVTPEWTKGLDV